MAGTTTLLCIHRDPGQLNLLKEKGCSLITATNGSDGLRLLMSQSVDAIVIEYYLGLLNGAVVADEIKQVRPQLAIVMVADHLELPEDALKSVDALVAKSDGPHFLLATIHAVLQTKQARQQRGVCAEQSTPPVGETTSDPPKRQILLVDDDPRVRESIAVFLISAGYDVVVAEDGFGALSQLRKALPDLIISDLDMPGMSGFELLSVVRRRFPRILTLAMSGAYPGDELPDSVIADGFYSKGGQSKKLLGALQELLRTSRRGSNHYRERAPAWIPRNGNDSHGMPYVMLTCAECLRVFQVTIVEETTGQVLEIRCRFCMSTNQYVIQPSSQGVREFGAVFDS